MRIFIACAFAFLMAGCAISHEKPPVDLPQKFSFANDANESSNLPYTAWWMQLNDETLNAIIKDALKNNNDINIAYANAEAAQGELNKVKLSWIPNVTLFGGFSQAPSFGNPGTFYNIWPQYLVNVMQLPFRQKQANYNLELYKAKTEAVKLTIIAEVTSGYLTYIAQKEQLNLLKTLQEDMLKAAQIKQSAFGGKIESLQGVELLNSEVEKIKSTMQIVEYNIHASQNVLRYLINQNPGNVITSNDFASLNPNLIKPQSLPLSVLSDRPDLKMAELAVNSSGEGINVSAANLFPSMYFDRILQMQQGGGKTGPADSYVRASDMYVQWNIQPNVFGEIEAQKGRYKSATYDYIKTVRNILKDVDNGFANSYYYGQKYSADIAAYAKIKKEYELQKALYNAQIISLSQLLESKIRLDSFAIALNQAKLEYFLSQTKLYIELAGGYNYDKEGVNK